MAETETQDTKSVIGDVFALSDGQPAFSARNEGDGTWSVRLGPGGPILEEGLPMEKALAIVGAPTWPYQPSTKAELVQTEHREALEVAASDHVNAEALKSDKDLGLVDERGRDVLKDEADPVRIKSAGTSRRSAGSADGARHAATHSAGGKEGNGG